MGCFSVGTSRQDCRPYGGGNFEMFMVDIVEVAVCGGPAAGMVEVEFLSGRLFEAAGAASVTRGCLPGLPVAPGRRSRALNKA